MSGWNETHNVSYPDFFLVGFPGLQETWSLLILPFFCTYLVVLLANTLVVYTVVVQRSLHQPMYALIALLLTVSLCAATAVVPTMFFSFSTCYYHISLSCCLIQMFSVYFFIIFHYGILLVMALDYYIVICYSLRYPEIVTWQILAGLVILGIAWSIGIVTLAVVLASRVRFCHSNIIYHFTCEHMALMKAVLWKHLAQQNNGVTIHIYARIPDMLLLGSSCTHIIHAAFWISSGGAHSKSLNTCGSHMLVIFTVYTSTLFSSIIYCAALTASKNVHNLFNALCILLPCYLLYAEAEPRRSGNS